MFLNVIPAFSPLPAVHGLGNARMIPIPRGFGQVQGCPQLAFDGQMENWLSSLQAESQADAAVGCGGGQPCASPVAASQMALLIAQNYCNVVADGAAFNCPSDPACNNIPASAAPYVAQALSFFNSFPASVWTAEAANLKSGDYYGKDTSASGQYNYNQGVAPVLTYAEANAGNTTGSPLPQNGTPSDSSPLIVSTAPTASSASTAASSQPVIQTDSGPVAAVAASTSDPFAFLTQSMIGGLPNWTLIGGGILVLFLLRGKR